MAYCHHPFRRKPLDVRSHQVVEAVSDFDESWEMCLVPGCDERVDPRRVALVGHRCLLHGATKLEAIYELDKRFVPAGAKQGYTIAADPREHVRGLYKGSDQNVGTRSTSE